MPGELSQVFEMMRPLVVHSKSRLLLLFGLCTLVESRLWSASRYGDFPSPDFEKKIKLSSTSREESFREIEHGLGKLPFLVRVRAYSTDGDSANFMVSCSLYKSRS